MFFDQKDASRVKLVVPPVVMQDHKAQEWTSLPLNQAKIEPKLEESKCNRRFFTFMALLTPIIMGALAGGAFSEDGMIYGASAGIIFDCMAYCFCSKYNPASEAPQQKEDDQVDYPYRFMP
jgi:hypothetical protein